MKTYFRLLAYVKPYWGQVILHALFSILAVVAVGLALSLLSPVLNLLFQGQGYNVSDAQDFAFDFNNYFNSHISNLIAQEGKIQALLFSIIVIVCVNIVGNIFRYFGSFFMSTIRTKVVEDLRTKLFNKIKILQVGYFEGERKGDLLTRMTADVNEIEKSVVITFQNLIREPFTVLFFIFLMMRISVNLTLFVFAVLPISAIFISFISKSLKRSAISTQEMLSWITVVIDEFASGIRVVKAFNAEKFIGKVFGKYNERYSYHLKQQFHRQQLVPPFSETMGVITIGLILWFGGRLVFNGQFIASDFLTFIFFFQQIMKPAKNISVAFSDINRGIASGERIFKLMDARLTILEKPDAIAKEDFTDKIEFHHVSFSYTKENVLEDINLKIHKGSVVALVGPSGSGKTTLGELILRFYDPVEGNITIDGIDIKNLKIHDLRELIGLVTQEAILFNDTIYNNIAFGMQHISEDEVHKAAKAAHAHDFIMQTDDGYNTIIGDRGVLLSGGQRQRLSIARAILKNPPILILDEATSALDTSSERIVQDALYKLMKNRTSIVIAHRLSTIQEADEIIVLENGKIVQKGSHADLISQEGLYYNLHKMQQLVE